MVLDLIFFGTGICIDWIWELQWSTCRNSST